MDFAFSRLCGDENKLTVRMTSFFTSPTDEGGFHLSAIVAMQIISQLGIIHGGTILGHDEKRAEVWMTDYAVKHRRPIRNAENMIFRLIMKKSSPGKNDAGAVVMDYEFNIDGGAARGSMKLYFASSP